MRTGMRILCRMCAMIGAEGFLLVRPMMGGLSRRSLNYPSDRPFLYILYN